MNDESLFQATVPVFVHYLGRIEAIVSGLDDRQAAVLAEQLVPETFCAGEHFSIAQGFALRTVFPLTGGDVSALSTEGADVAGLRQRGDEVRQLLSGLSVADFAGAGQRRIAHTAGKAELVQDAADFATLYGLPNFFFHLTMAYATLKSGGIELGKADFDAHHSYPRGFRFT